MLISTDASIFEIEPKEVLYPINIGDLIRTVRDLLSKGQSFTMRAGGTSIGGQAIGSGFVIDISKHLTNIIYFSKEDKEIVVDPGVIQDDLNDYLKIHNLKFAPDTSTSNRAMIGGMIGNNSCGAYSTYYGTTREHVKSVEVLLSDGSLVTFGEVNESELKQKLLLKTLEGDIYRFVINTLEKNRLEILNAFPDKSLIRRNTGYAIDELIRKYRPFNPAGKLFNLTPLICGSEGTLGVVVSATLKLVNLPKHNSLIVAQFFSDKKALSAVKELMKFRPSAVEFIDKPTLDASKNNLEQSNNRAWIKRDPEAVLIVEFFSDSKDNLKHVIKSCQKWLKLKGAYDYSEVSKEDYKKIWNVRKAGLGLLMGKSGPKKALAVIEDAAIPLKHLYQYYKEVKKIMKFYDVHAVYYGHASVGLIHVRPELDLSLSIDREKMRNIALDVSKLVKKYKGSLSGEHGDGRIRAPYIKDQFGSVVYQHLVDLKNIFDPKYLLNPGVIIGNMPITKQLRPVTPLVNNIMTGFDWSGDLSFFSAVEKCNGAGVCRQSVGRGIMCPSYKATRDEKFSTRGRANLLRRALHSVNPSEELKNSELKEALDLCLSCKACKSECPASVDMSKLKSEYLYQTQSKGIFKDWHIKYFGHILKIGSLSPKLFNYIQNLPIVKKITKIQKNPPNLANNSLDAWWKENQKNNENVNSCSVWVVCDPYTQYYDVETGKDFLTFLQACNVNINVIFSMHSIRMMISYGLLDHAKNTASKVINDLNSVSEGDFVVGMEVSEVLAWRDDIKSLIGVKAPKMLLFEELVLKLNQCGNLPVMSELNSKVWVYKHCHQKALNNNSKLEQALSLIHGIEIDIINRGCCGMAGDFGYKFPEISKKIAQQSLDGVTTKIKNNDDLVATGVSCRQQFSNIFQNNAVHLAHIFVKTINNKKC
jgi:FAD/FMN-containing dehydrogenase/Fe-S oxidoreductase